MATTTLTSAIRPTASGLATADEVRAAFTEHREELAWLAGFLTGDEMAATACVIDASTFAEGENSKDQEWLWPWPREATICSAWMSSECGLFSFLRCTTVVILFTGSTQLYH